MFCSVIFLFGAVLGAPALYDKSQHGGSNADIVLEDAAVIVIPFKGLTDVALSLLGRSDASPDNKTLFEKVLEKVTRARQSRDYKNDDNLSPNEISPMVNLHSKLQANRLEQNLTTEEESDSWEASTTGDVLFLVGGGLEECGPDGHRNSEGVCVYSPR